MCQITKNLYGRGGLVRTDLKQRFLLPPPDGAMVTSYAKVLIYFSIQVSVSLADSLITILLYSQSRARCTGRVPVTRSGVITIHPWTPLWRHMELLQHFLNLSYCTLSIHISLENLTRRNQCLIYLIWRFSTDFFCTFFSLELIRLTIKRN